MFDEISGLPVHPLVVHVAVVLVPLAGLLGVLFAIPPTRRWARVPLAIVAVGAALTVLVTRRSGQNLAAVLGIDEGADDPLSTLIQEHAERANLLSLLTIAFAVLAVAAWLSTRSPERLSAAVPVVLSVLLVLGAGALVFQTYRVGDIGSRAVWNPTGEQSYQIDGDGAE